MNCKKVVVNGVKDVAVENYVIDENNLAPTECIIENLVTYISPGTELSRVFGLKKGASYPMQPGYCCVGKVIKVGSAVTEVAIGDVVYHDGPHASHRVFDYSNYIEAPTKLKPETKYEEGAFLNMCQIATNAVLTVDVKLGDKCVVMGLGTLGLLVSILYKNMGVDVIAVDPTKARCDIARSFGIEKVVDAAPADQYGAIMALTGKGGADIVIEATGLAQCIEPCINVAAKHGSVVLLGSPRVDFQANITPIFNAIHMKMLNVIGAFNGRYNFDEVKGTRMSIKRNLKTCEELMNKKVIDVDKFISHRIKPAAAELMEAYDGLMNKKNEYTGVIINWED